MFKQCPKCGHSPLPTDQALPASCPACGVILAKVAQAQRLKEDIGESEGRANGAGRRAPITEFTDAHKHTLPSFLLNTPARIDPMTFWPRVAGLVGFAIWGLVLIAQDYRTGEMGASFIHRPLLIFHEAGHVVFRLLGHWMMVLGGTLGQLIMPAILSMALLIKNRNAQVCCTGYR